MSKDRIEDTVQVLRTIAEEQQNEVCEFSTIGLAYVPRVFAVLPEGLVSEDEFKEILRDLARRELVELRPMSIPAGQWPKTIWQTCIAAPDDTPLALVRVLSAV